MKSSLLAGMALVAGLLSGCASDWERKDCTSNHSFAWCTIKAAADNPCNRYMIDDIVVPRDRYNQIQTNLDTLNSNLASHAIGAVAAGSYVGVSAATSLNVFVSSTVGQLALVTDLLDSLTYTGSELYETRLYAWLPANVPEAEAEKTFTAAVEHAYLDTMGASGIEVRNFGTRETLWGTRRIDWLVATGGQCDTQICFVGRNPELWTRLNAGVEALENDDLPAFMGSGKAYMYGRSYSQYFPLWQGGYTLADASCKPPFIFRGMQNICEGNTPVFFTREQLLKFSSRLPPYVYLFVGATRGDSKVLPAIFNQGKVYLFVKPKTQS